MKPRIPYAAQPWVGVLAVLVLIELVVRVGLLPSRYFPPMTETFAALVGQLGESGYWTAIAHTLEGWAIGLGIAIVIAVPLGLALGFNDYLYRAARPIIEFLRPVPSVALIPLAILIYGTGLQSKVFLVAFASVWPLLIQTIYGARDLDPIQLETARSFRISRRDRVLRVTLMGAVPYIATGLRISSATALILAITAELIIGSAGLGREINIARQGGANDLMYALIITTGLIGWGLNTLFSRGERRVLHWHPSHRAVVA
ncbi:ABC transporter permease [Solirubrobacter phytolaccae]|uniref:ABC transporter permease n=1 Tax=Solirubrobacter phytolaccae TaxID=1404360 RepID=A0A9X3SCU5_9ACTN|nr:ABC transporter permease [Solirubrobacter phytolaccae]MDA0182915.1 ABC transporter permease [Solirubrobacter phytolaccae]